MKDLKMFRQSWVEIDKKSFLYNLKQIKRFFPKEVKVLLCIKSNAYGHDGITLSKEAAEVGIKNFAVSSLQEAISLRDAGIKADILIFGRIFPQTNLETAVEYNLTPTLSDISDIKTLEKLAIKLNKTLSFHLGVDTGMGRVGMCLPEVYSVFDQIVKTKKIKMAGLYTHLSDSDTDPSWTTHQLEQFNKAIQYASQKGLTFMAHAANSAAILRDKKTHFDMVRPGIALYGIAPFEGYEKVVKLKPVLSWKTKIVFIKSVPANSPISYGRSFITKRTSKIALLPIGYADGYDRLFSNKASVLIRGQFCPVIGAVTMNMTMIDVTNLDEVKEADEVVLIGAQGSKQIKAEDLAKIKGTIGYEIVCQISKDLPRIII